MARFAIINGHMKMLVVGALFVCAALGQTQPPKERKVFKPPDLRAFSPLVAKDDGCAKDLVKAAGMEGLAQRKFLADLLAYGCVRVVPGMTLIHVFDLREFGEGTKKIRFSLADLMPQVIGDRFNSSGSTIHGWVISDEIFDASWAAGPKVHVFAPDLIDKVIASEELQKKR